MTLYHYRSTVRTVGMHPCHMHFHLAKLTTNKTVMMIQILCGLLILVSWLLACTDITLNSKLVTLLIREDLTQYKNGHHTAGHIAHESVQFKLQTH
jgi:hypothetical protein